MRELGMVGVRVLVSAVMAIGVAGGCGGSDGNGEGAKSRHGVCLGSRDIDTSDWCSAHLQYDEGPCGEVPGCTWIPTGGPEGGYCSGSPHPCVSFAEDECDGTFGCNWYGPPECDGVEDCVRMWLVEENNCVLVDESLGASCYPSASPGAVLLDFDLHCHGRGPTTLECE